MPVKKKMAIVSNADIAFALKNIQNELIRIRQVSEKLDQNGLIRIRQVSEKLDQNE